MRAQRRRTRTKTLLAMWGPGAIWRRAGCSARFGYRPRRIQRWILAEVHPIADFYVEGPAAGQVDSRLKRDLPPSPLVGYLRLRGQITTVGVFRAGQAQFQLAEHKLGNGNGPSTLHDPKRPDWPVPKRPDRQQTTHR